MPAFAHWFLSDVRTPVCKNEVNVLNPATYVGEPFNSRGMLPEYGLSTRFNGSTQYITGFTSVGFGPGGSIVALVRPLTVTSAAERSIIQAGTTGLRLSINTAGQFKFGQMGGSSINITPVVAALGEYLVIGTQNGGTGAATLTVYDLLATRPENLYKLVALYGTASGTFTVASGDALNNYIARDRTGPNYFAGDLQGIALWDEVLDAADIEAIRETCTWTDVTPDVRAEVPINTKRGFEGDDPATRLAATGSAIFALNNAEDNFGKTRSWYSPGHANVRPGFKRGIPTRVTLKLDDTMPANDSTIQFLGRLEQIVPTSGVFKDRLTHCVCFDWMDEAAKASLRGLMAEDNLRADQVIALLLNNMDNKPHELVMPNGSDVYPISLDNTQDEIETVQGELARVALSEFGLIYMRGNGTLVFETRSGRGTLTAVLASFDGTMTDLQVVDSTELIINRAKTTVHPRRVDAAATTVLYESENRIALNAGLTTEIFLQFRDPTQEATRVGGIDVIEPVPTTDYTINLAEDGSGANITGNPSIDLEFTIGGNGVYLTVNNQFGQIVYLDIQVRGKGVYDFEPVTVIESNDDSIKNDGIREVDIDMPYQTSAPIAQSVSQLIIQSFGPIDSSKLRAIMYPARKSVVHSNASLDGEISSRIAVTEEQTGIDAEFFINGVTHTWNADKYITTQFVLTQAGPDGGGGSGEVWILDVSQLDVNTRLGF